jgi:hypothetical protein
MRLLFVLYWLVAGLLMGMGLMTIPVIGWLVMVPIGVIMTVVGLLRFRRDEVWALLIGFGALPAALGARAIVLAQATVVGLLPCSNPTPTLPAGQTSPPCGGPVPEIWYAFTAGYGVIALVGLLWALLRALGAGGRRASHA